MFDNPILNDNPDFNENPLKAGNNIGFKNPTQNVETETNSTKSNSTKYIIGGLIGMVVLLLIIILNNGNSNDNEPLKVSSYPTQETTASAHTYTPQSASPTSHNAPQPINDTPTSIEPASSTSQIPTAQEELAKEFINMAIGKGLTAYMNNPSSLNIRDEPSLNSNVIGNIPYGGRLTLKKLGPKDAVNDFIAYWVLVDYEGTEGWAWGRWIQIEQ